MIIKKKENTNWGKNIKTFPKVYFPKSYKEIKKIINSNKNFLVQGNLRSYGDNALNNNIVISTQKLNKIIKFDEEKGIIEAESGVLLNDLLKIITLKGWFIPVSPGTKYVSLGGMIANNIHGKNTYKNQIKYYVKKLKLISSNKEIICSKSKNKKLFNLTIGGFGLTGAILSITLKLKKIYSENIEQKIIEFKNFKEFYQISKINKKFEYSVCWIHNLDRDSIQGLYYLGNHSKKRSMARPELLKQRKTGILLLIILKIINSNYYLPKVMKFIYRNYIKVFYQKTCHYNDFFYPQDNIPSYNTIYGKKGFMVSQFLIPEKKFEKILSEISDYLNQNKIFYDFVILKKFKEFGRYLNFSGSGYSISFTFVTDNKYHMLKKFLNNIFSKYNLKVDFAKDLILSKKNAHNFKEFKSFKKNLLNWNKNKKINSLFSKRLGI